MILFFYKYYLESILKQNEIQKEDILAVEALRQKYHIPFSKHITILSDIEDGVVMYTKAVKEFGIMSVWKDVSRHGRNRKSMRFIRARL